MIKKLKQRIFLLVMLSLSIIMLGDNAIKHTKFENKVIINLKRGKNEIIFEVKNMGDPIPEEEREKIFERFYRIDKSRNRQEKRYGLGLAIAKSTIEKNKCVIIVTHSQNVCNEVNTVYELGK